MQLFVFLVFVAVVIAVSRKLASLGSGPASGSASGARVTGSARRRRGAAYEDPGRLGNELADTLKAWVEEKGVRPTDGSRPYGERVTTTPQVDLPAPSTPAPPPLPPPAELEPLPQPEPEPEPAPRVEREPSPAPEPPLESLRAQLAAQAEAELEPIAMPELPTPPRSSFDALPAPSTDDAPLDAPGANERADDDGADGFAASIAAAVRAALDAPPGPELALSSSLSRPVSDAYSAVLLAGGFDDPSAESAFARVASGSSFFGLSPTARARLDAPRLAEAVQALRRASPALAKAIAADLERLEGLVSGVPGSRAAVAALRRLVPAQDA